MNHAKLTVRQVRAMLKIAANKDVRGFLNGLYLDAENGIVAACNGHMLFVARPDMCTIQQSTIVPRGALEIATKGAKPTYDVYITDKIEVCNGEVTIGSFPFQPIDGRYPEIEKVIPRDMGGQTAQFNIDYLSTIQDALRSFGSDRSMAEIAHNGMGAALVTAPSAPNAFGVVMPMRAGEAGCELHDEFKPKAEAA